MQAMLPIETMSEGTLYLDPDLIDADPDQPRREFDPAGIRELMESIAAVGLIEPLVVVPAPSGRYRLVAGERRLRAVKLGARTYPSNPHFQRVPVRMLGNDSLDSITRLRVQLDENRHRENLTPGEIAGAYRAAKLALEIREAERYLDAVGGLPDGYDRKAPEAAREKALRSALRRKGVPWPDVPWSDVFAALGQPMDRRVLALLQISDAVLTRCDELGLTKSAAAALAELPSQQIQLELLEEAARAGDPGLVTPAVDVLLADPSLGPKGAIEAVLATRRAVKAAREAKQTLPPEQMTLPKPPCPTAEFEKAVAGLRQAIAVLETFETNEYQAGSIRLLLDRLVKLAGGETAGDRATWDG